MDFKDQYKHPKWQELRLAVMSRAKFICETCGNDEQQLQVHHKQYLKGHKIWEYNPDQLECLCATCHESAHEAKARIMSVMACIASPEWAELASLVEGFYFRGGMDSDPISGYAGVLARAASNHLNVYQMVKLVEQVESVGKDSDLEAFGGGRV